MISDALKFLAELGAKASGATAKALIVEHPTDRTLRWLVTPDRVQLLNPTPPDRTHKLYSIVEFDTLLARLGRGRFSDAEGSVAENVASVWVWGHLAGPRANAQVVAVLDDRPDSLRYDRATCVIATTDEFELMRSLTSASLDQRSMRQALRVQLADCNVPQSLIDFVSQIDWCTGKTTSVELRSNRESLGADIKAAAMSSAGEMPEQITLMIRIFNDASLYERTPICCVFSADPKSQTLALQPRGNALQMAYDEALAQLRGKLVDRLSHEVPVYLGMP